MLIPNKGALIKGLLLLVTFGVVLVAMFLPLINGHNALEAADRLFNSIAKGSTYFIGDLLKKTQELKEKPFTATLKFDKAETAEQSAKILSTAGAQAKAEDTKVTVTGNLQQVMMAALTDSDAMFKNNEQPLLQRYGLPGKQALLVWWKSLKEIHKDLTRQKQFAFAASVDTVIKRGVEVAYNFYGIEAQTASSKAGVLTFALIFYVVYTLWWGVAIMFLFDAFGLEMKKKVKKEV
ncbi:MAG: hypothetical protein AB1733_11295 [Thermodesulfobacteriota bacterium]